MAFVYVMLAVIFVGGAGIGYLVLNPPSDFLRQKITEQIKARTGRDLAIAGPASFEFFPALGMSLSDVSLSSPPGMDGALVRAKALHVSLDLASLFDRQPQIKSVTLRTPVFDFRTDKNGRSNWKFAFLRPATKMAELQMPGSLRDAGSFDVAANGEEGFSFATAGIADVRLENVMLEDGTFRFSDERSGRSSEISGVNVSFGLPSLQSPLVATGNLVWHDQRLDFEGKAENLRNLFRDAPAHLAFKAKNALISASYDGDVMMRDGATLEGQVRATSDSARDLAQWFGTKLPPVSGFGPMAIEGLLRSAGNVTEFSNARFQLDGEAAKGTVKITSGGARPFIEANLTVSALDLNKYLTSAVTGNLAREAGGASSGENPASTPATAAPDAPAEPDQIEKLLRSQGTKVYGVEQRAGWSSETLNLALLGIADGNAHLAVGKLRFKNVSIGQSTVDVAVKDRAMQARFADVALYNGHGRGVLSIDGASGPANIGANFNLASVSALPFLKDAANFGWVAGNANVQLKLAAKGASQLQLIENLNGTAGFQFSNGAVVGFDFAGALHGLSQGNFAALRTSSSAKTDFSALAASFTVTNGVAQNQDLQLVSPLLRVTGSGTVQMPQRTVDYVVKPKLLTSAEAQQGDAQQDGIEVPVHITGSWDRPTYQPDLSGVLSNPGKAVDAVKQIGKKLKGKNPDEIVDSLFGDKPSDDPSTEKTKKKAKNLLNKFFGKQDAQDGQN